MAAGDRAAPFARSAMRPVITVALGAPLDDTMTAMRDAGTYLAAVAARTGGVAGLVTMEYLLEELVGAAQDGDT